MRTYIAILPILKLRDRNTYVAFECPKGLKLFKAVLESTAQVPVQVRSLSKFGFQGSGSTVFASVN